jgi:uncharacterized membrane protein
MDGQALSKELRTGRGLYLFCRRGIVLTSFVAGASMMMIGVYQMGILGKLPEPRLRRLKSSEVAAVAPAYRPLGLPIPDSLLGLLSYAVTAALAGFGGPDRPQRLPCVVPLMTAKVLGDAILGAVLFGIQWAWYRAFCMYCLIAAGASFAAVPLAVPETWAAWRRLRRAQGDG